MSKKKSYMNKDNILSEGFYTNIIKFFLPKKVKDNLKQSQLNRLQNDIDKIELIKNGIIDGSLDLFKKILA